MNKQVLEFKEAFLAEIDNQKLSDDDRLVIASKGFDKAFKMGAGSVEKTELTTEEIQEKVKQAYDAKINEGLQPGYKRNVLTVDTPDYSEMKDDQLLVESTELMVDIHRFNGKPGSESHLDLLVRMNIITNEIVIRQNKKRGDSKKKFNTSVEDSMKKAASLIEEYNNVVLDAKKNS